MLLMPRIRPLSVSTILYWSAVPSLTKQENATMNKNFLTEHISSSRHNQYLLTEQLYDISNWIYMIIKIDTHMEKNDSRYHCECIRGTCTPNLIFIYVQCHLLNKTRVITWMIERIYWFWIGMWELEPMNDFKKITTLNRID